MALPFEDPKVRQEEMQWMGSFLLTSFAVVSGSLSLWRLGSDLGWAGEFPVPTGPFAHWQAWGILAAVSEIGAYHLRHRADARNRASRN